GRGPRTRRYRWSLRLVIRHHFGAGEMRSYAAFGVDVERTAVGHAPELAPHWFMRGLQQSIELFATDRFDGVGRQDVLAVAEQHRSHLVLGRSALAVDLARPLTAALRFHLEGLLDVVHGHPSQLTFSLYARESERLSEYAPLAATAPPPLSGAPTCTPAVAPAGTVADS